MTYADSGFVVSLYLTTEGTSERARKAAKRAAKPILLSPLSLLEIRNALNFGINRGEVNGDQRDALLAEIERQMDTGFFRMVEVGQAAIYAKALELSNKHTPTSATRSLDLMHLAAALLSRAQLFLTFDRRQSKAAIAEGLKVYP